MSGFNNFSTRKEDFSMKLKVQNVRHSKSETAKLEDDTNRLEQRLMELKIAMTREKEEREKQGGMFWSAGKPGPLANHPKNVLNKEKKSNKAVKIKILKDEKNVKPLKKTAPAQPGTFAHIAQMDPSPPKNKIKGPKCGQCERKGAAVVCQECSEEYCSACFASFHLKGALRKHRSIPLHANGPRVKTPRSSAENGNHRSGDDGNSDLTAVKCSDVQLHIEYNSQRVYPPSTQQQQKQSNHQQTSNNKQQTSIETQQNGFTGGSLWDGPGYNEQESAADFQRAIAEWRGAGRKQDQRTVPPHRRVASPVKSPVVSIDEGCNTEQTSSSPRRRRDDEIVFHNPNISYADRLLLKQNRRTELASLPPECAGIDWSESKSSYASRENTDLVLLTQNDERVDFRSLHETAVCCQDQQQQRSQSTDSQLSVIELQNTLGSSILNQSSSRYKIEDLYGSNTDLNQTSENGQISRLTPDVSSRAKNVPVATIKSESKSQTPPGASDVHRPAPKTIASTNDNASLPPRSQSRKGQQTTRTPRATPRSHAKSISTGTSRPQSRANSRPQSRANSRPQSRNSRPSSRIKIEGVLTKKPSAGLSAIAKMTAPSAAASNYRSGIGEFLMAGVEIREPVERTLTPSGERRNHSAAKKQPVSFKLYQMSPKAWRPDSSLGDCVSVDDVQGHSYSVALEEDVESTSETRTYLRELETLTPRLPKEWQPEQTTTVKQPRKPASPKPNASRSSFVGRRTPTKSVRDVNSPRLSKSFIRSASSLSYSAAGERNDVYKSSTSGRESTMIMVDGKDMTEYDDDVCPSTARRYQQTQDDRTLGELEWELASQTGHITDDGKISRLSLWLEDADDDSLDEEDKELGITNDYSPGRGLDSPDQNEEFMVDLLNEELDEQINDEAEVEALR
ncbi:uncharacterized protein LOC141910916 [Tubulanus polymorphus]|uniref:uncharacterized protein LOC141910916 n=1 Tax=Tubulanus polymorphus TaxID=672921 RepID=UPI003DA3579D